MRFEPVAGSPLRIADDVISVLSELPFVGGIALFGSLAENRADCWSDVDMHVACADVERSAWAASAAIVSAKPTVFYRKFSDVGRPSGRYWFEDESPFNRLDVSFVSMENYRSSLANPDQLGYGIRLQEVYNSHDFERCLAGTEAPPFVQAATDYETELGSYIYFSLEAMKSYMRGYGCPAKHVPRIRAFQAAIPGITRDTVMSGGCIGKLAHQVWEMLEHIGFMDVL